MAKQKPILKRENITITVDSELVARVNEIRWTRRISSISATYNEVVEAGVKALEKKYNIPYPSSPHGNPEEN